MNKDKTRWIEYNNHRLTQEIEEIKQRVSDLEIAYEELLDELRMRKITDR